MTLKFHMQKIIYFTSVFIVSRAYSNTSLDVILLQEFFLDLEVKVTYSLNGILI